MANALLDIINLGEDYHVFISKCDSDLYDGKGIRISVSRRYRGLPFRSTTLVLEDAFDDPCTFEQIFKAVKHELSDDACKRKILKMMDNEEEDA